MNRYTIGDAVIRISDRQLMYVNEVARKFATCIWVANGVLHTADVDYTDLKLNLIVSEPLYKENAKGNGGGEEFVPDDFKHIYDSAEPGNCNKL